MHCTECRLDFGGLRVICADCHDKLHARIKELEEENKKLAKHNSKIAKDVSRLSTENYDMAVKMCEMANEKDKKYLLEGGHQPINEVDIKRLVPPQKDSARKKDT